MNVAFPSTLGLSTRKRTTNLDWSFKFQQHRLADENFAGFCAKKADFVLSERHLLPRSVSTD
jgi:hypothetical protein